MYRALQYIVAGLWAVIVMFATLLVMAICLIQPLEDVEGWWQILPLAGELAILPAVGLGSFRYVLRSFARQAARRANRPA